MQRRFVIVLLGLVIFPFQPVWASDATWRAGVAVAKITPEKPLWQAGYGARTHPADGTLHDLWVKVLVLEAADQERAVLVTSDLLGFPKDMSDAICSALQSRFGLARSQVMLAASHTHGGPVLRDALYDIYPLDDGQIALIEDYSTKLQKKIIATVAMALNDLAPATIWVGKGSADFAANRRNNPQGEVRKLQAEGIPLKGPVDHDVPVLVVRDLNQQPRVIVFGYACHGTTLSDYKWSGDYAGFAQIALEQDFPGAVAMFFAGCGADQNPLPRRSVALCGKYGYTLADAVAVAMSTELRPIHPRLATAFRTIDLAYESTLTKSELEAEQHQNKYYQRRATRLLDELRSGKTFASAYPYPIQAWKLGDNQLWIALGGEVVVDYSLRFKKQYGPRTWITGYANDVMAYIPSHRVWQEGGYESGAFYVYGLPANRWAESVEDRIADNVDALVKQLNQPANHPETEP